MKFQNLALFLSALVGIPAASAQTAPPRETPPASSAQGPYQPKFSGDPARSESEASALGYIRVVIRAQKDYEKKHNHYATSLADLVNHGSFTRRMAKTTDRGEYTVAFRGKKDGYVLTMTPKNVDAEHRSFYADEDGVIHADETKAADPSSPKVK
jgi:hypothetical protein